MGLFDGIKGKIAIAQTVRASREQWARIIAVEPGIGPLAKIRLEMHLDGEPPFEYVASTRIPRGFTPVVGQEVAIVDRTGPGASVATYHIKWDGVPQHGFALADAGAIQRDAMAAAMASLPSPPPEAPDGAADTQARMNRLIELRVQGVISAEEYDAAVAKIVSPEG